MQSLAEIRPSSGNWIFYPIIAMITGISAALAPWLFIAISACLAFVYFWKRKDHFLIFLILYTPFEELILKMIPDGLYAYVRYLCEIMIMAMMAMIFIEKAILSRRWRPSPVDVPVLIFICVWFISSFVNSTPLFPTLTVLKNIVRYIPLVYIIRELDPDGKFIHKIFRIIFILAIIQSFICIGQAFSGDSLVELFRPKDVVIDGKLIRGADAQLGSYHTRFTGSFPRANDLGNYLALALCLMTAVYLKVWKKRRYLLAFVPIIIALFLTSSRISWISAYFGIGIILFLAKNRSRFLYLAIPMILLVIFFAGVLSTNPDPEADDFKIVDRFAFMFTSDYIDVISTTGRLYTVMTVVPAVFNSHPLLGLGPGSFMRISEQMSEEQVYARAGELNLDTEPLAYVHDIGYAALFVQVGILGLAAITWIFLRIYKIGLERYRAHDNIMAGSFLLGSVGFLIAVSIQNLASFNFTYRNQSLLIWVICGLILLFSRSERPDHENNFGQ